MATVPPEFQETINALSALYNAPSNSAKKEANRWLEDFQAKVQTHTHTHLFFNHCLHDHYHATIFETHYKQINQTIVLF